MTLNPMLSVFLKLTGLVALVIIALMLARFLLSVVVVAAVVAAIVVGVLFAYRLIRRVKLPVIR